MALTGLFLCLFLVGHLLGNLQLIFITGEEGRMAFNDYAYFMTHNPAIKILSYVTYFSILFHAIDGLMLTIQNKKARPVKYAYNKPGTNSSTPSRYMAILGSAILIFIVLHMANFWGQMKFGGVELHKVVIELPQGETELYVNRDGSGVQDYLPVVSFEENETGNAQMEIKNGTTFYNVDPNIVMGEGQKDLHSLVMAYFGQDKSMYGFEANKNAMFAVILYVVAMLVLMFHLWHGFASAFQTLGAKNERFTPMIENFGKAFSVLVPIAFAIIPILIFLNK
jgi:succinate dehydrogenase / fumarate reductase cytochrome b subunit